jgi:hypothetical protein
MESQGVLPARIELLNAIDQQIEILMTKAFAAFTPEERSEFKTRQERIRDLEQQVAIAKTEQIYDRGVFAGIYRWGSKHRITSDSRTSAGDYLQHLLKLKFDFYDSLLPVLVLDDLVFPVVLVLEVLSILNSYLLQFVAE